MNKDKILDSIEKDISEAEEFYIPIKKIWHWLQMEYKDCPALQQLTKWLRADKRFIIHDIKQRPDDKEDEDLEGMGYFSGPRSGLAKRHPTKEDMARIIMKHAGNVTKFLKMAHEARPRDLPEEEQENLDELLRQAKTAEDKIKEMFKRQKE